MEKKTALIRLQAAGTHIVCMEINILYRGEQFHFKSWRSETVFNVAKKSCAKNHAS